MGEELPIEEVLVPPEQGKVCIYKSHYQSGDIHTRQEVIVKDFPCANLRDVSYHIREGVIQAAISHDNICKILAVIPTDTSPAPGFRMKIVFESCTKTLAQEILSRSQHLDPVFFTESELRIFLRKIASALCFAHAKRTAHRSVNPDHIFLAEDNEWKLSDFGTAWRSEDHKMAATTITGDANLIYQCPKMKAACALGIKSVEGGYDQWKADVYSLGVTVLHMARLSMPLLLGGIVKHEENVNILLHEMPPDITERFKDIIRQMLTVDESERFDSRNVLEALAEGNSESRIYVLSPSNVGLYHILDNSHTDIRLTSTLATDHRTAVTPLIDNWLFACGGGNRPCT